MYTPPHTYRVAFWLRLSLLALPFLLAACGDPIDLVRQSHQKPDTSRTVAQVLESYPYFKKVTWTSHEDKDGKIIVQAECDIDIAATCKDVSTASMKLATRDVRDDYLLAQYVVVGWPRKIRPQYAIHVTRCLNGNHLAVTDPKSLQAIYRGERLRFFCLEGLNCPPTEASQEKGDAEKPPATQ